MTSGLLGRTNASFPPVWLSLIAPTDVTHPGSAEHLVHAALESDTVIDISSSPALWGGFMRGTDATLMSVCGADLSLAMDEPHTHDLVQAHLIESLCGIGREHLDFYFLPVKTALKESQISGALIALEAARQEGHIRFFGLSANDPLAAMGLWQMHDAFEAVLLASEKGSAPLRLLAKTRRVAVVSRGTEEREGEAVLVSVSTPAEIHQALTQKAALR